MASGRFVILWGLTPAFMLVWKEHQLLRDTHSPFKERFLNLFGWSLIPKQRSIVAGPNKDKHHFQKTFQWLGRSWFLLSFVIFKLTLKAHPAVWSGQESKLITSLLNLDICSSLGSAPVAVERSPEKSAPSKVNVLPGWSQRILF